MKVLSVQKVFGAMVWVCMLAIMAAAVMFATGCASVATNRYLQARNPTVLEVAPDGSKVLLGVDVFSLDQVAAHPWMTTGAAVVDVAMGYGVYALGDDQGWWGGSDGGDDQASGSGSASGGPDGSTATAPAGGDATSINVTVSQNSAPVTIHVGDSTVMAPPVESAPAE